MRAVHLLLAVVAVTAAVTMQAQAHRHVLQDGSEPARVPGPHHLDPARQGRTPSGFFR